MQRASSAWLSTGTLSVTVEIREATQPKPISLRGAATSRGGADGAAVRIQSAYRGKAIRKSGVGVAHGLETAVPLAVGVSQLKLNELHAEQSAHARHASAVRVADRFDLD